MHRVSKILEVKPYKVICEIDHNSVYEIDLLPIMENHKHFSGIEKLNDNVIFDKVAIGEMGELFWENIILINGTKWNYDLSPEFIVQNGNLLSVSNS